MPKSLKRLSSEERDIEVDELLKELAKLAGNDAETIAKRVAKKKELQEIARQRKAYIQAKSQEPQYILERQTSAARKSTERRSAERRAAEIRSERQRKIDKGELIEGTAVYEQEVVPGVISLNRSEAEMENRRASNRARYNEAKEANPGLFSSTRYARGKRHNKKTNKSHKKRKTHKKRKSAHKKSRKH